jgi:polysaccharide deacetylase family protein (PEP-CTERM system associated)
MNASKATAVMSIDVEEWFHILDFSGAPPIGEWPRLESRVETSFRRLLALMSEQAVHGTCFFLGWIGERFPQLVREAAAAGHEIASHGYSHDLVFRGSAEKFATDITRTKNLLEDICGQAVLGYRAPGFSLTAGVGWYFDELARAGYRYDASVFPAKRGHGGIAGASRFPHVISTPNGNVVEFPATVTSLMGLTLSFFGGGYLRVFPYSLIHAMSLKANREGVLLNFYIHPREIDPGHPRLPMPFIRRFKSYVGLKTTESKLNHLMSDFYLGRFQDHLQSMNLVKPNHSTSNRDMEA